jgi:phage terminase small subunit
MPMLENPRHELFCHEYIANGFSKQKAYSAANPGCALKTARTAGSKLYRTNEKVRARIAEIMEQIHGEIDKGGYKVLSALDEIAHAKITDVVTWAGGTILVKSMDEIAPELHGAIAELTEIPTENGPRIKIRMHDKVKALELMGRNQKLFTDKIETSTDTVQFADDFSGQSQNTAPPPADNPKTH